MIRSLRSREKISYARSPRGVSSTTIGTRVIPRLLATLARIPFFASWVTAQRVDGVWDAAARVRRILSETKPHVEQVTCRKPSAKVAEERGLVYARWWVDRPAGRDRGGRLASCGKWRSRALSGPI